MNNLSSYCGLVEAKIRASDKDLPVQRNVAGPLNGQLLIKDLIAQLGHYLPEVRFWVLTCLAQIYPKNEAFSQMLLAESTEPNLKLFRERSKFLTNLAFDSPPLMNCKDEDIKIGVFRYVKNKKS